MTGRFRIPACLALLVLAAVTMSSAPASAYPVFGETWQLRQPDGSLVDVRIWGDEYYQVVESLDGYTLVRDPATQVICYARLAGDGRSLESTGVRLGSRAPATLGLAPHLRITAEARRQAVTKARSRPLARPGIAKAAYSPAITGNVVGLCLLVDFSDQTATIPQADVDDFCNLPGYTGYGNNGSVRDYYGDVSDGALDYTSYVAPNYFRAPQPFTWYDDTSQPWLDRGIGLIYDILDQMEADGFDFSQYDSNGDGYIDAINLFYAGSTTAGWAQGMWPGSGWIQDEWSADGVSTLRFQITGMGNSLSIGTYCHENGHMLGFWPDLYDYDGDSAGIGSYCLMSNSGGTNPVEPCAYLKLIAGWGNVTTYASQQLGIPVPTSSSNTMYKFDNPGLASEYWLVENRQQTGRDQNLPDSGLAIWHIDTNGDHSDNQMTPANHFLVTLVQADGSWDLENNVNSGDGTDLWAAPGFTDLLPSTSPDTDWWDGSASNMSFFNVSASAPVMTFDFSPANLPPFASCQPYQVHPGEGCCATVAVADIDGGSGDPNGPGDIQSLCITAVDGEDVGCQSEVELCDVGTYELTLTITDLAGESSSCTATVELVNQDPVAVCAPYAAVADDDCCIEVDVADIDGGSYDPDGAEDIAGIIISAIDGEAGPFTPTAEVCGDGEHQLTLLVTDRCGATSSCEATVTVLDETPPEIAVDLDRYVLWPPNHKLAEIAATVTVTDNCDPDPEWVLVSIESDEPLDGAGDGHTAFDWAGAEFGTSDDAFQLRSERSGKGDGRVYTIIYTATDDSGNSASDTVEVRVPHDHEGWAMAATGFSADGTGFASPGGQFLLLLHSRPARTALDDQGGTVIVSEAFDATAVDRSQAYVGNSLAVLEPLAFLELDENGDGLRDLALVYPVEDVQALRDASTPATDGRIARDASYGPVGLHYTGADGGDYLVADIFALGEPVAIDSGRVTDRPERKTGGQDADDGAAQTPRVATGLEAALPNPFNPMTRIAFGLARDEAVALDVYDLQGRLVKRLVDGPMSAGEHTVTWDGRDRSGGRAPAGIYLVRLMAGQHRSVMKISLIK